MLTSLFGILILAAGCFFVARRKEVARGTVVRLGGPRAKKLYVWGAYAGGLIWLAMGALMVDVGVESGWLIMTAGILVPVWRHCWFEELWRLRLAYLEGRPVGEEMATTMLGRIVRSVYALCQRYLPTPEKALAAHSFLVGSLAILVGTLTLLGIIDFR